MAVRISGPASLQAHFGRLRDPRIARTRRHALLDIIVLAICAVVAGADDWVSVRDFGRAKLPWLRQYLVLPNGIPSHDTFGRVFGLIDPDELEACFSSWIQAAFGEVAGGVIAIDGKTVRRSHDRSAGQQALQMVSAWATSCGVVCGQRKVDGKSNEITAIPELLNTLATRGCIVTIDAIGCQTEIAEMIAEKQSDYVLAVKENQGSLRVAVKDLFDYGQGTGFADLPHSYYKTVDKDHGRIEVRQCWAIDDAQTLKDLPELGRWKKATSVVMVVAERRIGPKRTSETRYYLTSLTADAKRALHAIRAHWGIENSLHWVLDVAFREDESRVRTKNSAENLSRLRRIALNLVRQDKDAGCGVKTRRKRAGWDNDYLIRILNYA
jgi:predicted transposase YbfD/YdcC